MVVPRFGVPWPYVVPTHPSFDLRPGDVEVTEDGKPICALQPAFLARSAETAATRAVAAAMVPARRVAAFVPLTFGRLYVLVGAATLGTLVWGTLARPAQLFTQPDSFGYLIPGLV